MPLARLIQIVVAAIAAAGVTVWLAAVLSSTGALPDLGLGAVAIVAMLGAVVARALIVRAQGGPGGGTDGRRDRAER